MIYGDVLSILGSTPNHPRHGWPSKAWMTMTEGWNPWWLGDALWLKKPPLNWQKSGFGPIWPGRGSRLLKRSPAQPPQARPVHTEVPEAAERSVLLPSRSCQKCQGQQWTCIKYHQISSNGLKLDNWYNFFCPLVFGELCRTSDWSLTSPAALLLKLSACHPHPAHRSRREAGGISPNELDQVAP